MKRNCIALIILVLSLLSLCVGAQGIEGLLDELGNRAPGASELREFDAERSDDGSVFYTRQKQEAGGKIVLTIGVQHNKVRAVALAIHANEPLSHSDAMELLAEGKRDVRTVAKKHGYRVQEVADVGIRAVKGSREIAFLMAGPSLIIICATDGGSTPLSP